MSVLANSLRPFWTPGLNDVSGNVAKGISSWLSDEEYRIYSAPKSQQFTLHLIDTEVYLAAIASDVNRTSVAAYESISQAAKNALFPKSTAWIIIKSYYAAFFAAHAIIRMLGTGFAEIDKPQAASLNKVAKLFGVWQEDVKPGSFTYSFARSSSETIWHRFESPSGGVHQKFWAFFKESMDELSEKVLKSKAGLTADNQQVSAKLTELVDNLCYDSSLKGTWLSAVRNRVNYKHQFGAWYPYKSQNPSGTMEERLARKWREDPMTIDLTSHGERSLRRFQETCSFIIGCCRVLASDMEARCSTGKSFQTYGWLAIDRLAQQRNQQG